MTQDRIQYRDKYKELREMNQWIKCRNLYTRNFTIFTIHLKLLT